MTSTSTTTTTTAALIVPIEHVFKTVDGLDVLVDVYVAPSATRDAPSPVILWWHGGGLLQGNRKAMAPHLLDAPLQHGITVVSADYRLAPQTRLPGIIADARDAAAFVQSDDFARLVDHRADNTKLFLSGSSAGGWLALIVASGAGFQQLGVEPLPEHKALLGTIPIYPITDITQPFWTTPQRPVSYMQGRVIDGPKELGAYLDPSATPTASSASDSPRANFYHYMLQEAILGELLLAGTGVSAEDVAIAPQLEAGKITLPPTCITHGTIDDKVPISQAQAVVLALEKRGIPVQFIVEEGKDHLYDREPHERMEAVYAFVKRYAA